MSELKHITLKNMKTFIPLSIIAFILFSCGTARPKHSEEFIKTQKELTEKLTVLSKSTCLNGFGVALANDKEVLYQNGFGIANIEKEKKYTENTVQNIASVSKTLIGIAVLKAQELGKLKLDDPINKYLPFKVFNPQFPETPITIRQLTTHTSSIADGKAYLENTVILKDTNNLANNLKIDITPTYFNPPSAKISIEEFLSNIFNSKGKWYSKENFTDHKPGEIYEYSNLGATLAALVVEKATGISYDKFTNQYILKPLKMTASGWDFNTIAFSNYTQPFQNKTTPYPYYSLNTYPDGGILTTSQDMSKYIFELLKGFAGNGTLLSKTSYKEYFTPQLKAENFIGRSTNPYSDEYNTGINIGFSPANNFGHYGGDPGTSSAIWFNMDTKTGRYFIANTDWDRNVMAKDQTAIYSLLDEYLDKLNKLSRKEQ